MIQGNHQLFILLKITISRGKYRILRPFVDELDTSVPINKEKDLSKISKYDLILFHTPHSQFEEINFEEIEVPIFDATGVEYLKNSERI